jgi:N-acetylglucosamine-6-phosphate deacetylase
MQNQTSGMAKIFGIHLEGIFLNPEKKGIHNSDWFLKPTIENYKLIEDDFIKIVTLAPEFAKADLMDYLNNKNVKIQAGHCVGGDLTGCNGVTHLFNAMSGITHRGKSTALSALIDDNIYTEIIADGVHVSDDALKLIFKSKPIDKIILISDCLPCTNSNLTEFSFAGENVYYDGKKATSKEGTLAGSTTLLPNIIKRLASVGLFNPEFINNPYKYHNIDLQGYIEWDKDWNILKVNYEK